MIPSVMTGKQLKDWRLNMGWSQKFSAEKIGVCEASYISYETGRRTDKAKTIVIPLPIAWATAALAAGLNPYSGIKK